MTSKRNWPEYRRKRRAQMTEEQLRRERELTRLRNRRLRERKRQAKTARCNIIKAIERLENKEG